MDVDVEEDVEGEGQGAPSRAALEEWSRVQICAEYSGSRFSGSRFSSGFSSSSRFSLVIGTTTNLTEVEGQGAPESP